MDRSINEILDGLTDFTGEERETVITFDHYESVVYLETTHTFTARRWVDLFAQIPEAEFELHRDSLGVKVPMSICRKPEAIIKHTFRPAVEGSQPEFVERAISPTPVPTIENGPASLKTDE